MGRNREGPQDVVVLRGLIFIGCRLNLWLFLYLLLLLETILLAMRSLGGLPRYSCRVCDPTSCSQTPESSLRLAVIVLGLLFTLILITRPTSIVLFGLILAAPRRLLLAFPFLSLR